MAVGCGKMDELYVEGAVDGRKKAKGVMVAGEGRERGRVGVEVKSEGLLVKGRKPWVLE